MLSDRKPTAITNSYQATSPLLSPPKISRSKIILLKNLNRTASLNQFILPSLPHKIDIPLLSPCKSPGFFPQNSTFRTSSPVLPQLAIPSLSVITKSTKPVGKVLGFCANTHKGVVREVNEDRAMIISRIPRPSSRKNEKWPHCSYFGLYDGHGGKECANFLRDNLHKYIIASDYFPKDPTIAILEGFEQCENDFTEYAIKNKKKCGSCAIVLIIVENIGFIANLGDSRAVMSELKGNKITQLSNDHKPDELYEKQRLKDAGAEIYQHSTDGHKKKTITRVFPGRLSVSRTIGDIDAKISQFGGNPDAIIAIPEIKKFKINTENDFIILASDGVFDKLENEDAVNIV